MLHFELYDGSLTRTHQWHPPTGSSSTGTNRCASEYLSTKPDELLDPNNFIAGISSNFCAEVIPN